MYVSTGRICMLMEERECSPSSSAKMQKKVTWIDSTRKMKPEVLPFAAKVTVQLEVLYDMSYNYS
jgi:hypothetical protein